jgi:serine/threonine protein kinase
MGVVSRSRAAERRRRVALKVIRAAQLGDELRVPMFQREAETLGRLKHPDIAAVYESGRTEDGQHFLAMELAPGETLDAYLATRPRTVDRDELAFRLRLISRIADAAHYAHQRGVIHRDLKPANVIVTAPEAGGPPGIKILDFGIARVYDSDSATTLGTVDGLVKGTMAYMSPEQARGESAVDVRTDVYAIGVMAYETLTGVRPYDAGGSLITALKVICDTPPRRLAEVWPGPAPLDPDVEVIVNKALAKVRTSATSAARWPTTCGGIWRQSRFSRARPRCAIMRSSLPATSGRLLRPRLSSSLPASPSA